MKFFKIIAFFVLLASFKALAQTPQPALITVSGKGQIKIVPDIVNINFGVETTDVTLSVAKARNDWKIDQILNFLNESGIESKDIRTYNIRLDENKFVEKRTNRADTPISKYYSTQSIKITLNNLSLYSTIVEGLINSGITKINGIQFTSSKNDSLTREARLLALRNAREKAEEMAKEYGQKIGAAYTIRDGNEYGLSGDFSAEYGNVSSGIVNFSGSRANPFAEGEIEINQYVTVSFYLK